MSKILITGGTGFIGYHLAKRLAEQGHETTLADNFFRSRKDADLLALLEKPNVKLIEGDLTDKASWEKLGTGYDYVYHFLPISHKNERLKIFLIFLFIILFLWLDGLYS